MKLLDAFARQLGSLDKLRYVWMTSFTLDIEFVETYLLPKALNQDQPRRRADYENLQLVLNKDLVDFRVFCDYRFMGADQNKRTAIPVHGVSPAAWAQLFSPDSLFHPKVIYLEDVKGNRVLGTGSANLTLSGWARNQEAFLFERIETETQYEAVRGFFSALAGNAGLAFPWPERAGLSREPGRWSFVHSFQDRSFVSQFFTQNHAGDLLVWSPYLSHDLMGLVQELRLAANMPDLRVHLVPDLVDGQYVRAPWNEALQAFSESGALSLYRRDNHSDADAPFCHAKIWKLGNVLAIGSWNFTSKGANLPDPAGARDSNVNIEAGMILSHEGDWQTARGEKLAMSADRFASDELLAQEALVVPSQLPFDAQVRFDWHLHHYFVTASWHVGMPMGGYALRLPGHDPLLPLNWEPQEKALSIGPIKVHSPGTILHERRFQVLRDDVVVYRALIIETEVADRPAQAFESLEDLLNAMIFNGDTSTDEDAPFRVPDNQEVDALEALEEPAESDSEVTEPKQAERISYFRLFQATHQYAETLKAIKKSDDLHRWVFTRPGCLLELIEKTHKRNTDRNQGLFNWFLTQEVRTLCQLAKAIRHELATSEDDPLQWRWDSLELALPTLPDKIPHEFVQFVRKECGYASN
ncbi:hypothetical protein C7S18_11350 [Ahniella affigens]|uniref:PLD phosphodiesterase domain-containing protein n=1 Tax=Ahniella affigens TaxID=2021234 RepID=A0A2P1PSC9_9GAMM|nr:hypothetical protein [Ahniella affigens]AVP97756.1 hypothetical protein C7S18_11350 [Ahniella affigens]